MSSLMLWMFVHLGSGWTMRGSKLWVRTELLQSGCWDVELKWGFKVSIAGIMTTMDCQLGLWADTRSRQLTLLNPASCTEGLTTWVSVTVKNIAFMCLCKVEGSSWSLESMEMSREIHPVHPTDHAVLDFQTMKGQRLKSHVQKVWILHRLC